MKKTLGFLSMQFEKEEKRDFRPSFFKQLNDLENIIYLDRGFGEKLGFSRSDYEHVNKNIQFCDREKVLQADVLISIRTPIEDELRKMKRNTTLFSMLHFVTHEHRNTLLSKMGVKMYAMDSVIDDFGLRIIQDFPGTAKNALRSGFDELNTKYLTDVCRVLLVGPGEIGRLAVDYALKLAPVPAIVKCIGRSVTKEKELMRKLLSETDVLVDSSKRNETHKHIIDNDMLGALPEHAVIVDISADDYDVSIDPIQVKGIEGIPTGNLKQYVFDVDDEAYSEIPDTVSTKNRRKLVSCYSWPGIDPTACLDRYETQLEPFIRLLALEADFEEDNNPIGRALFRGSYEAFQGAK